MTTPESIADRTKFWGLTVSASLITARIQASKMTSIATVATLLHEHSTDLTHFLATDARGQQLPAYLQQLTERLASEPGDWLQELNLLNRNIEVIEEIGATQQSYASLAEVIETVAPVDLQSSNSQSPS